MPAGNTAGSPSKPRLSCGAVVANELATPLECLDARPGVLGGEARSQLPAAGFEAQTLDEAGLPDTAANNEKIIEHLLDVGETVTPEHFKDIRSELVGPAGKVKVLSTWKILPDGRAYLATVKLIPKS